MPCGGYIAFVRISYGGLYDGKLIQNISQNPGGGIAVCELNF